MDINQDVFYVSQFLILPVLHRSANELAGALDVGQTAEAADPFAAWQQAIRALAEDMDAQAVDDEGRPITLQHYTTIAADLQVLYRALEARDMAVGWAVARRLFQ